MVSNFGHGLSEGARQTKEDIVKIINNLNIFPEGKGCQLIKLVEIIENNRNLSNFNDTVCEEGEK